MENVDGLYFLMLRYPSLSDFIKSCAVNGEFDKLWDMIVTLK